MARQMDEHEEIITFMIIVKSVHVGFVRGFFKRKGIKLCRWDSQKGLIYYYHGELPLPLRVNERKQFPLCGLSLLFNRTNYADCNHLQ